MICYMPFAHLPEKDLRLLSGLFGRIQLYHPAPGLLTEQEIGWEKQGLIDVQAPCLVDEGSIKRAVEEYKAWANDHRGRRGDLAGFFPGSETRTSARE